MPTNIFKALLADTISTMTTEELRNIILNTPDKDLEAVGAAVLAEKRKKATQINQPGVQVPVENIQGAEEGGAVPKTAKKSKTAKRKVVAKKPTKKISAQKAGPSKRKYDTIDLTSDTDEETPESIDQEGEDDYDPSYPQGQYATKEIIRELQSKMTSPLKYTLHRMAEIMDHLDWERINCRDDLIRYLVQGEIIQYADFPTSNHIVTKEDMSRFLDEHHARFNYHPMFTAIYSSTAEGLADSDPDVPARLRRWTNEIWIPSYDWNAVTQHLRLLDFLGNGLILYEFVQDFCSSYDNTIQQYTAKPSGHSDIKEVVSNVNCMSILATNMSSPLSRQLKYEFRGDQPMSKLQDCMATLCAFLGQFTFSDFTTAFDKGDKERQKVLEQLKNVDRILRGKYPDPSFRSGIEKVKHLG